LLIQNADLESDVLIVWHESSILSFSGHCTDVPC
jgi:hypothetical protein